MRWRLPIALALVACLYGCHVRLKTAKIFANPTWDWQEEVGQFWSEFAFHYRFAKFFAEHPPRDWGLLTHDRRVQHPDEVNDWAEFTIAMEVPAGVSYRWWKPALPFHVWVVWYDCLVSSLSLFAIFFLARELWRSHLAGLMASVLYAGLYPSYGRTVKNLFLKEDFAIPLIVLAVWLTVRMLREGAPGGRALPQIVAGLVWLAALASWHLTQFVLAVGVGAAVLVYLGKGETPRRPWFVVVLAAGAVLVPVLRAKQFYLSPTMCGLYALSLAVWVNGGRKKAFAVFVGSAAVLVTLGWLLQKSYGEYAHVYQLFFYKLRYLGVKPADPARLPWEARCLWEGAFETAGRCEWWRSLMWCGPLAAVGLWKVGRMEDWGVAARVFAVFTLLLVPLSWMVVRYFTFLGWAAAVMAAGVVAWPANPLRPGRAFLRRWAVAALAVWQLTRLDFQPLDRASVAPAESREAVNWINDHTPTNAVVLASIAESPVFLTHTGRPIILHSKFENREIRERYRQFLEAAYGGEETLAAFCRQSGADYFVWDAGFLTADRRYKAGVAGEPTALPAGDGPFRLEMSNSRLAVFRVLKE